MRTSRRWEAASYRSGFRAGCPHFGAFGILGWWETRRKSAISAKRAHSFSGHWNEPFGIAITEALASGCAVFGTPYGSLPEIVTVGSGFLSADASELLVALRESRFDPAQCRARAEKRTHSSKRHGKVLC